MANVEQISKTMYDITVLATVGHLKEEFHETR